MIRYPIKCLKKSSMLVLTSLHSPVSAFANPLQRPPTSYPFARLSHASSCGAPTHQKIVVPPNGVANVSPTCRYVCRVAVSGYESWRARYQELLVWQYPHGQNRLRSHTGSTLCVPAVMHVLQWCGIALDGTRTGALHCAVCLDGIYIYFVWPEKLVLRCRILEMNLENNSWNNCRNSAFSTLATREIF